MKINVDNFKEILRKATINFNIQTVQLRFGGGKIKSNMIASDGNAIALLDVENDVIDTNDEVEFNFSEPAQSVIPYLNLFDNELVDINLYENRIRIIDNSQKSTMGFCSPMVVSLFGTDSIKEDVEWFFTDTISDEFKENFNKIKKIGARFGKVYFDVSDKIISIETCDKTNQYSNGLKFELSDIESDDITLCFDYKDMVNLMSVIGNRDGFSISLTYKEEQELGMLYAKLNDNSEKYCLMSKEL